MLESYAVLIQLQGIVVGYDHRKSSSLSSLGFAHITAAVFVSQGFKVSPFATVYFCIINDKLRFIYLITLLQHHSFLLELPTITVQVIIQILTHLFSVVYIYVSWYHGYCQSQSESRQWI
jgi:hypothetical protein